MSPIPFSPPPPEAAFLRPDAKLDILDVHVDASVAVRCRCGTDKVFLVMFRTPRPCPECGTMYDVGVLQVVPDPQTGQHQISVRVGPLQRSGIVTPGGAHG